MSKFCKVLISVALLVGSLVACTADTPETTKPSDDTLPGDEVTSELVEYLFAQHSERVTLQDGILTLYEIGEDVLYFSDRPHRIVGRETLVNFLEVWDEGKESFATIPPNAVLTVKQDDHLADLTVILKNPVLSGRDLVYEVEVLDGPESGSGNQAALFIDAFMRKLLNKAVDHGIDRAKDIGEGVRDGVDLVQDGVDGVQDHFGDDSGSPSDPSPGERHGRDESRDIERDGSEEDSEIR